MKFSLFLKNEIKPHRDAWIVILFVSVFILLRLPSLVEPYWYGDEGIYQVIGKALNSGRVLYQGIWDNKPPLLYYIYAVFNGDQFLVRSFSLIVGVFSVISFYFLGKVFFKKKSSLYIATILYVVLFGSPIVEGNIANAENFMHLPIILSAIFLFKFIKENKLKYIFISGLLLSVAFMTKIVAIFEFSAFFLFLIALNHSDFFSGKFKNILKLKNFKVEILFILGFIFLPVLFTFYFVSINAFPDFLSGVLSENIDYVGVGNNFIFPMGILVLKIIIALLLVGVILYKRESFSRLNLLLYLWLVFALFSTFFSQRPYLHYILMTALPFFYLVGSIIETKNIRILKIIISGIILIIIYLNFGIYNKTSGYYQNYIDFVLFNKKIDEYHAFFDVNTPRDYELARFIETFTNNKESVFLWSDSGQIYALSETLPPGKYIVAYHITYYNNAVDYMVEQISKTEPRYIIKTKDSPEFRNFIPSYILKYKVANSDIYERQN